MLAGDPVSHTERGTAAPSHFCGLRKNHADHVYCGHATAGWIRIPLGTEVGLGPSDIVLDGDPAPRARARKGAQQPLTLFGPLYCGRLAFCMHVRLLQFEYTI